MKKRILSGLLAAVMLFTTAFAANGDTAVQTDGEKTVVLRAVLPEDSSTEEVKDVLDKTQPVLEKLLERAGYPDASVTQQEDTLAVTLPAGADELRLVSDLNSFSGLTFSDGDGKVWLGGTGDFGEARVVLETTDDAVLGELNAPFVQVELTERGAQALAEAAEANAGGELVVSMDGEELMRFPVEAKIETDRWNITAGLTEQSAAELAALINAGIAPAAFELAETGEPQPPDEPDPNAPAFPDIENHWAYASLQRGAELGILKGIGGKMLPDNPVKRSEAVTMLGRALGAEVEDDISGLANVTEDLWFAPELAKGVHLGLLAADDSRNFDAAATRAEAFVLLARAFAYDRAPVERDAFGVFTDTASMTAEQKNAASALVAAGVVNGITETTISPSTPLTRAQFVTMLLRIAPNFPAEGDDLIMLSGGALITAPDTDMTSVIPDGDRIFACGASKISLSGVEAADRIVLKGAESVKLTARNKTTIGLLALDPAGTAGVTLQSDCETETLLIAGTGGKVTFSGKAETIEITSTGRTIDLTGMEAEHLIITGSGNTILMNGRADYVQIVGGAKNNTLTLNKATVSLLVAGMGSKVDGRGRAEQVEICAIDCEVTVPAASKLENIDQGLAGVGIEIGVPTKVPAGGSLYTQVKFTGVTEEKVCRAEWYQDGKPIPGCSNDQFALTADKLSSHTSAFTFTKDMQESVTIGFKLTYENPSTGETEEVYEETTVPIENYSDEWYYQRDVNRVLNLVSSTYRGNYTTAYAINNDYQPYEKEVWINAKGYSSNSGYLLWINRAYQHVNVFTGSKGKWKLDRSFLVGTGAMSTPTPTGVTTVSYKSAGGWTTSTYTVRPVVGFYPGTGYAFHSRLCYPGTDTEYDHSGGYPISHGCVRMNKADVQWIYNNVPVGTTVVIF